MKRTAAGFILIEVIIAFIVIAVGTSALVQLHRGYLRQEANSGMREQAMHLAENKLDDLRTFEVISSTAGKFAYQDIATNLGGTISAGVKTISGGNFTLSWSVTNSTLLVSEIPVTKDVTISVTWVDSQNQNRSLRLASTLSQQTSINLSKLTNLLTGGSGETPLVSYTPGSAPDVVAVTIKTSGTKMETSKPLPTIYRKGESTVVQFETVTYDIPTQKLTQEDQLTLSCNCSKQSGEASYIDIDNGKRRLYFYLPASFNAFWATGENVSKSYGLSSSNPNSPYCTICCNNHFDGAGNTFDQFFNQQRQHHDHYSLTGTTLTTSNNDYLEACRLLRIDGFYQPMPDWNLVALNIMSADFLSSKTNQTNYEHYVQETVRQSYLNQKSSSNTVIPNLNTWLATNASGANASTTINSTVSAGSTTQLIARGIYVDNMSSDYLNKLPVIASAKDNSNGDLLSKIPFNEINLTLLANWSIPSAADQSYATITNDDLVEFDPQHPGNTYSRGRLGAIQDTPASGAAATVEVQATVQNSNSGITNTQAISPSDAVATTSTMGLTISTITPVTFHGDIKCLTDPRNKNTAPQSCSKSEWSNLTVSSNSSGTTCTMGAPVGNSDGYFDCTVIRGSNVIINFAANGYVLAPSSISLPSTLTNLPASVSWYRLNAAGGCSLMMVKDSVTNANTYSCN